MGSLGEGLVFVSAGEPDISETVTLDATTTSLSSIANRSRGHADPLNHCGNGSLVGPLSLLVQGLLAFLAFTSLIGKLSCYDGLHDVTPCFFFVLSIYSVPSN